MAVNNRIEAISQVDAVLIPTLTLTQHKALLKEQILTSTVLRKDVIASETPSGGNVIINYINKDTATVVTTGNLVVSFTNLENGDVKYLAITKSAANAISFAGATDVSARKAFIDKLVTSVTYEVMNKNGEILVNSVNIDNAFSESLTEIIDIGDWDMDATSAKDVTYAVPAGFLVVGFTAYIRPGNQAGPSDQLKPLNTIPTAGILNVAGLIEWSTAPEEFQLRRTDFSDNGIFDQSSYSGINYNRGYIVIQKRLI